MSINKKYIIASAMMASVALPLMNASHVDAATDMRTVTASSLNFRTGPSTSYSIINVLMNGQKVEYISTSGSWLKVKYNGVTGYVHGDYVTKGTTDNSTTGTTKYVSASVGLNVRSGAGTSYSKLGKLEYKEKVTVLSTSNGWSKINYNGKTGYVDSSYLKSTVPGSTDNTNNETTGTTKYVNTTSGLNVRSGAGTSYSKLGKLEYKEKVTVLSTSNGWSKINYNGKTGYVDSSYLQNTVPGSNGNNANNNNNTVSTKANEVIAYAKTLLGKPYVWGAQGPNSFDCSGFTYYVFKNKAGIVLPRTSSAQSKYGTYVSKSNLKAGDLVFFDTNGANDGNVSHVGMYIGNGQMIHASYGQKKIVIANFNDSYYQKAYVNARRVL